MSEKTVVEMAHEILADFYPADSPVRAVAAELIEYDHLFELQRKRTKEADLMWQKATGRDVWPDLGELLTWLLKRIEELEEELEEWAEVGEAVIENQRLKALLKHLSGMEVV